jgi:predicted DNA-binding transcriptional regulator AlpA
VISSGRQTLTSAFSDLVRIRHGIESHELPETFAADEDGGENDICRYMVTLDAAFLAQQFVRGRIATFVRPLGGGDVFALKETCWEIDDALARMATGALNLEHWADPDAVPTHRIFVDAAEYNQWLASLKPLGALSAREIEEALNPQLRAARALACRRLDEFSQDNSTGQDGLAILSPLRPEGFGPELLTLADVCKLVKKGRSSVYSMISETQFPEPIKLGSSSRWAKQEVLAWIEEQAARRGEGRN